MREMEGQRKVAYQPSEMRIKIYLFFEKVHLVNSIKKFLRVVRRVRNCLGIPSSYMSVEEREHFEKEKDFLNSYEMYRKDIIKIAEGKDTEDLVIISGYLSTFEKGGNIFFKKLGEQLPHSSWLVISQSGKVLTEREREKIAFEMLPMPKVPFKGGYDRNLKISCSDKIRNTIMEKEYLQNAVLNIKAYHDDMGDGYAEALVYYSYRSVQELLDKLHPKILIVHNKFYVLHDIMVNVCKEKKVKTLFFEFGALPGTFALEENGQMGSSRVAVNFEEFNKLLITKKEIEHAYEICNFLKTSGLNRNRQIGGSVKERLATELKLSRPIILYAGQNDYDSGICPYDEKAKRFHSPVFSSSDEVAFYLAALAKKNDWNLIYKPHPLPVKHGRCLQQGLPENVIWISDVDINQLIDQSDVVVTILSQVADIALIRGKATVMLGYTQLKGKGCCYEAYTQEEIELQVKTALKYGYTKKQEQAFAAYVARSLKYYLFDDLNEKTPRFGRDIKECGKYICKIAGIELREPLDKLPFEEHYFFEESDLFNKRIVCNEMDFLDLLASSVGKENIRIKLHDESSRIRFEIRGYKASYVPKQKWEEALKAGALFGKILVAMYPMHDFMYVSGADEIYLFHMFVGNYSRFKESEFLKRAVAYTYSKRNKENVILYPANKEEYQMVITYLQRRKQNAESIDHCTLL